MRIVFVSEIPTVYRTPLFRELANAVDLHVLYCAGTDPWRGDLTPAVEDHGEILPGISFGGSRGGVNWKFNPLAWKRLSGLRPDVVVCSGYAHPTMQLTMLWCRTHKVPYVLHSESSDLTPRSSWKQRVKAPAVRSAVRGAAAFLPVSSRAAAYLQAWGGDPRSMFILPNAPDVEEIARRTDPLQRGSRGSANFLFVGRLVSAKDPMTLLRAFKMVRAEIPRARLTLVGEGPLASTAESFCASEGVDGVSLPGFLSLDELISLYDWADCFVLPSSYEPYGVVVLEAMAAGLPVILSDRVGSGEDLVDQSVNGFIFRVGDADELAARMVQVVSNGSVMEMGARSRAIALRYDFGNATQTVLEATRVALTKQRPTERR